MEVNGMRGRTLHNFIAKQVERTANRFFDFVTCEYCVRKNGVTTFFDIFARQGPVTLAIEIETSFRHAVDNAWKAAQVGVPLWFVVPRRRLQFEITRKLDPLGLRPGGKPIKILLLGQLEQELSHYLSLFIAANT
jgi:hypothetical protein